MTKAPPDATAREYRTRIRAWILYDWANSAFATTILAAVLPVYYKTVAGATLPSGPVATKYWTLTLSASLAIVAVLAPVLGTMADVVRGKKRFLGIFVGLGVIGTALLALVGHGEWLLASMFFVIGRVGFAAANVFYDSLLPHVAKPADQDRVSSQGYAFGYLGGGILLAANAVMLILLPASIGYPATFVSVAVWWAAFSVPLFLRVPEPPAAVVREPGSVVRVSFRRLGHTLRDIRKFRQLFRFLIAFLIYNDGIGTIIGVAAIYGSELGFKAAELILAILLVQFVGIPFSLVFGGIASEGNRFRAAFLAFAVANVVLLPVVGFVGARVLPREVVGGKPAVFETTGEFTGESPDGVTLPRTALAEGDSIVIPFHGRSVRLTYTEMPGAGTIRGEFGPIAFDLPTERETTRYGETFEFDPGVADRHRLTILASGGPVTLERLVVLPAPRQSDLALIFGLLVAVQALAALFAATIGRGLFRGTAARMNAKSTIALALVAYAIIAGWGFVLDTVVEFWFLAFLISVVQGGSQALSRSLYSAMSPTALSGEFFGLFSVMAKFSAIAGPLVFVASVNIFGGSRPAMLGVMAFFVVGFILLMRVDVEEGKRVAEEADERAFAGGTDERT